MPLPLMYNTDGLIVVVMTMTGLTLLSSFLFLISIILSHSHHYLISSIHSIDDIQSVLEGIDYAPPSASASPSSRKNNNTGVSVGIDANTAEKVLPGLVRQYKGDSNDAIYTTWKARRLRQRGQWAPPMDENDENSGEYSEADVDIRKDMNLEDTIVKRCIDYIFYSPYRTGPVNPLYYRSRRSALARNAVVNKVMSANGNGNGNGGGGGGDKYDILGNNVDRVSGSSAINNDKTTNLIIPVPSKVPLVATSIDQVVISLLLRSAVYSFGALIPIVAIIDSSLSTAEKALVVLLGVVGLAIFEITSQGTIFKPQIRDENVIESIDNNVSKYAGSEYTNAETVNDGASYYTYSYTGRVYTNSLMLRRQLLEKVGTLSKKLATESYGRPGVQPLAILDLFSEAEVGDELLPNERYPSDHLSIGVDFEIIW